MGRVSLVSLLSNVIPYSAFALGLFLLVGLQVLSCEFSLIYLLSFYQLEILLHWIGCVHAETYSSFFTNAFCCYMTVVYFSYCESLLINLKMVGRNAINFPSHSNSELHSKGCLAKCDLCSYCLYHGTVPKPSLCWANYVGFGLGSLTRISILDLCLNFFSIGSDTFKNRT